MLNKFINSISNRGFYCIVETRTCVFTFLLFLTIACYCCDCSRSDLACQIALDATATVSLEDGDRREIDIKRYAKVEKVRCNRFNCTA